MSCTNCTQTPLGHGFVCMCVFQSKEERILELETENALLHLRFAEVSFHIIIFIMCYGLSQTSKNAFVCVSGFSFYFSPSFFE